MLMHTGWLLRLIPPFQMQQFLKMIHTAFRFASVNAKLQNYYVNWTFSEMLGYNTSIQSAPANRKLDTMQDKQTDTMEWVSIHTM